ncbi:MAG TPA: prepilin-type N-terminal cleavage/methylation domain-containing protein [Candidatus Paceibacterota bacterium]|nr:prepilin-type N-terminal cleavage/methylation domain-containing protein [Candidatus Paceibacterota bacterium]
MKKTENKKINYKISENVKVAEKIENPENTASKVFSPSTKSGFTMVETLVAIFILLISITGPMAIAQSGLRAAYLSRDQTTAFYLAQDAIEYIKNLRDNNFIKSFEDPTFDDGWLDGLEACNGNPGCTIDTTQASNNVKSCTGQQSEIGCSMQNPLKINSANQFGFIGENDSNFYRKIETQKISPDDGPDDNAVEISIIVTVGWTLHGYPDQTREIIVQENIFEWFNTFENLNEQDDD